MPSSQALAILVIEDDAGHARLIEKMIVRSGITHHLTVVTNGQEAVDYLLKQAASTDAQPGLPHLVLLDMQLPGLDGIQVLERLKANEYTQDVPILMMSSTESAKEMVPCAALGCAVQLVKPIGQAAFFEALHHLGIQVAVAADVAR